jgi:hypothetical protein
MRASALAHSCPLHIGGSDDAKPAKNQRFRPPDSTASSDALAQCSGYDRSDVGTSERLECLCSTRMPVEALRAICNPVTPARSAGPLYVSRHPFQRQCGASRPMISRSKSTPFLIISAVAVCICGLRAKSVRVSDCLSASGSRSLPTLTPRLPGSSCMGRCCALNHGQAAYLASRSDSRTNALSMPLPNRSVAAFLNSQFSILNFRDRSSSKLASA